MPSLNDYIPQKQQETADLNTIVNNPDVALDEKIIFLEELVAALKSMSKTPTNMQAWELPEDYESQFADERALPRPSEDLSNVPTNARPSKNPAMNIPTNTGAWELPQHENPWMKR